MSTCLASGVGSNAHRWLVSSSLLGCSLALGACGVESDGTRASTGSPQTPGLGPGADTSGPGSGTQAGGPSIDDAGLLSPPFSTGSAGPGASPGTAGAPACARAELTIERTIPTVWLLIDGSGSMGSNLLDLGAPSRWSILREALLALNVGLVTRLQGSVSFGLMIYDGGLSPPGVFIPGVCPRVVTVDPALNNYGAIDAAYPADALGASTPTHYALEELSGRIAQAGPSPSGPTYVVLATDGMPNLCDFHDGIPSSAATEQQAVATVRALSDRGIKSFAISMASGDVGLRAHLDQIAAAGATGQRAFDPGSKDALASVLSDIIGGTVSCDAQVQGSIVRGRECAGDVRLNGMPLVCNSPDGFRLKPDGKTLELLGDACQQLQRTPNPHLQASFACDDVVLN